MEAKDTIQMKRLLYMMLLVLLPWFSLSCEKGNYASESEVRLEFSADTVAFDTLFTTLGSTTRYVKVYNRSGKDVLIGNITLAGGSGSRFRLNVDGDTSMVARNVEILAGDSIFIFIQANLRADTTHAPFIVEDAVLFSNGQRLPVSAWGRNAVFHRLKPSDTTWYSVIDCANWDHSRPHVIIGAAAVLDGNTLTLTPGDQLYFANDAMLVFDTNARILANGTDAQPILFTSLRHDGWYSFLPGQWQCLWFTGCSTGNIIDHPVLENGTGGLRAYPGSSFSVSNTVIRNMSDCALIGQGGAISASNLLIYDCLGSLAVLQGGTYNFSHCTFADYWTYSSRQQESVLLANYLADRNGNILAADLQALFSDCIIWGSRQSEMLIASDGEHLDTVSLTRCWVKGIDADDPLFIDPADDNYRLQDASPAAGKGYQFPD